MLNQKSRYKNTPLMSMLKEGEQRLSARQIGSTQGLIEHQIQEGNRLDHLAQYYYNDDRLWWHIVDANPDFIFAGNVFVSEQFGQVILIPKVGE